MYGTMTTPTAHFASETETTINMSTFNKQRNVGNGRVLPWKHWKHLYHAALEALVSCNTISMQCSDIMMSTFNKQRTVRNESLLPWKHFIRMIRMQFNIQFCLATCSHNIQTLVSFKKSKFLHRKEIQSTRNFTTCCLHP